MRDRYLISILVSCALIAGVQPLAQAATDSSTQCLRCHKRNGSMEGVHASVGTQGLACTSCHGDKGQHPKGKAPVITYGQDSVTEVTVQNQRCARCHQPGKLRAADWTHDVHLNQLSCAACHRLHPDRDPIRGITETRRTQLCVDCHGARKDKESL
ncbi:nitrite reductase [Ferrimonas sediminicola]|uniref:Nitrite reductase n=1 Tax=Ferrimonas sediminicola TaxID=2569538 RepID=A0A4U1BKI5_9GAMM|nr:cytochrome c3 family protein [Ferrimonas sediminicola]TKB51127.1 nitrite reductase [Ferrimonas sediminicola]